MDILWSDPTDNNEETGILSNYQKDSNGYGNIVKFSLDIVKKFLHDINYFILWEHMNVL